MLPTKKAVLALALGVLASITCIAGATFLPSSGYWTPSDTNPPACSNLSLRCAEWIEGGDVTRVCCVDPSIAQGGTDPNACIHQLWSDEQPRDDIP